MLSVLCTGTLTADPQRRMSAKGSAFATGLMRCPVEGEDAVLVSVITFSASAIEALLALGKGDSIACTGRAKLTEWTNKDGEQRHGISVTVERIMSSYSLDKKRQVARAEEQVAA